MLTPTSVIVGLLLAVSTVPTAAGQSATFDHYTPAILAEARASRPSDVTNEQFEKCLDVQMDPDFVSIAARTFAWDTPSAQDPLFPMMPPPVRYTARQFEGLDFNVPLLFFPDVGTETIRDLVCFAIALGDLDRMKQLYCWILIWWDNRRVEDNDPNLRTARLIELLCEAIDNGMKKDDDTGWLWADSSDFSIDHIGAAIAGFSRSNPPPNGATGGAVPEILPNTVAAAAHSNMSGRLGCVGTTWDDCVLRGRNARSCIKAAADITNSNCFTDDTLAAWRIALYLATEYTFRGVF